MSQSSNEPTRDGSGAPAPAPPTGAVDHRAVLFRYFIGNENRFTGEALRRAASAAGYSDADIDAAWERSQVGVEDRAVTGRYRTWARLAVLALYVGTFLLFVLGSDMNVETYGIGSVILGITLLVALAISMGLLSRDRRLPRDPLMALTGLLLVPVVLLVIVAGLCVVTTNPRFGPGPV